MKRLINKGRRRLGVPGRPALIIGPNEAVPVDDRQIADLHKNRTVLKWLEHGVLVITDEDGAAQAVPARVVRPKTGVTVPARQVRDQRQEVVLPDGVTGEGVEFNHLGGGWWEVWVNGFKVTDRNVRKAEAKKIAKEYE